jgi:hypothetical protein
MISGGGIPVFYKYSLSPSPIPLFTNIYLSALHILQSFQTISSLQARHTIITMFAKYLLPIILASSLQLGATAVQVNYYSDTNCANFVGSANPDKCDAMPSGIGSWLAVCGGSDECLEIETFNSNGGGCADEHAVTGAQCSCNGDPGVDDSRKCINASGQTFWSTIVVSRISRLQFCLSSITIALFFLVPGYSGKS